MPHQNIPAELRALPQWVVSGTSKIPFNPRTGQVASPTDRATWGTFEEALATGAPNIGFVLTKEDPFCIIDLDDKETNPATDEDKARFAKMVEFFDTYIELSTSGRGIHIVLKGSIPAGVHRDHIEVYSDSRYMIFTGNAIKNVPISDAYQETLTAMHGQMVVETVDLVDREEIVDDDYIVDMASNAVNGDKFNSLCAGEMSEYPSQSEADLALLSILAYYSQSDDQVRRLFRMSALGKREKATKNDRYIDFALRKIRAKQPPPVDMEAILARTQKAFASTVIPPVIEDKPLPAVPPAPIPHPPEAPALGQRISLPPGLVGEVAQFIYASSIRPVPEISLAAAIALVAGIAGRAYNTSTRAGLSQYIALLAKTGTGKEAAAGGMSILLNALRQKIPAALEFMGPSVFASGPALHRIMAAKPCFVSVLGEFGLLLQKLSNRNANTADLTLKKTLLDAYGKSGYGNMLQPSVYSDKEKDVAAILSPNITILGESTPESFYEALDPSAVTSGFLPRFFIIEYFGERPPRNVNPIITPPEGLLNRLGELMVHALQAQANNTCLPVMEDTHAKQVLDDFDRECDRKMSGQGDVLAEVWNRAHLKALKLSALIAVGVNPHNPVVTPDIATWAVALIRDDSARLSTRFQAGDIGEGVAKQRALVVDAIKWYFETTHKSVKREAFRKANVIERSALHPRVSSHSAFKGTTNPLDAFNRTLADMVTNGELQVVPPQQLKEQFKTTAACFVLGDNWNPGI